MKNSFIIKNIIKNENLCNSTFYFLLGLKQQMTMDIYEDFSNSLCGRISE